ncbi:30584_t:CDS:2 [Gigaspora margarita]|uniref:30584_t:CDS:1 n=1 Tax=Gigaspora margarita TaxID=4874 RepID=A0ABN7WN48_GIGMA|nr:30584_t:CDS:2 [Gigaspora margarita]
MDCNQITLTANKKSMIVSVHYYLKNKKDLLTQQSDETIYFCKEVSLKIKLEVVVSCWKKCLDKARNY